MTLHARTSRTSLLARAATVGVLLGGLAVSAPLPALATTDVVAGPAAADVLAATAAGADARTRLAPRASRSGARPRLDPAPAPAPLRQQTVSAPRVLVTERLPLPFRTLRREDPSRYRGVEAVVRRGRAGVLERTYADLGPGGRVLLEEERVREPVTQLVAVGTKRRPVTQPKRTYGGLDWAALARCESGGDPRAVSSSGRYRGLYQFSMATWRSVGGSGDPIAHSRDSQTARAYALYQRQGRSPWPHCGRHL